MPLTFVQALLFGALIAPTDPIAVIGILRRVKAPKSLDALIAGESLLNDGVGVVLFVAFPVAFAALATALHIPLTLMLVGVVLRGSAFVFRGYGGQDDTMQRRWGRIFAMASVVTPVLLGVCAGAVASGGIRVRDGRVVTDFVSAWLAPFPFAIGLFTLTLFAFLAAVYLTLETDDPALREDFRRRALLAAVAVGALALASFLLAESGAPAIRRGLAREWWSLPFHVLTGRDQLLAGGHVDTVIARPPDGRADDAQVHLGGGAQVDHALHQSGHPVGAGGAVRLHANTLRPDDRLRLLACGGGNRHRGAQQRGHAYATGTGDQRLESLELAFRQADGDLSRVHRDRPVRHPDQHHGRRAAGHHRVLRRPR